MRVCVHTVEPAGFIVTERCGNGMISLATGKLDAVCVPSARSVAKHSSERYLVVSTRASAKTRGIHAVHGNSIRSFFRITDEMVWIMDDKMET